MNDTECPRSWSRSRRRRKLVNVTRQSQRVTSSRLSLASNLATMNSRDNCGMITALHTSLDKRIAACENNEVFRFASCLDPRFSKLQWCRSSSQREAMIAELSAKPVEYTSLAPTTEDVIATVSPTRKRSKLFDFMTAFYFNISMFHYCIVSMLKNVWLEMVLTLNYSYLYKYHLPCPGQRQVHDSMALPMFHCYIGYATTSVLCGKGKKSTWEA